MRPDDGQHRRRPPPGRSQQIPAPGVCEEDSRQRDQEDERVDAREAGQADRRARAAAGQTRPGVPGLQGEEDPREHQELSGQFREGEPRVEDLAVADGEQRGGHAARDRRPGATADQPEREDAEDAEEAVDEVAGARPGQRRGGRDPCRQEVMEGRGQPVAALRNLDSPGEARRLVRPEGIAGEQRRQRVGTHDAVQRVRRDDPAGAFDRPADGDVDRRIAAVDETLARARDESGRAGERQRQRHPRPGRDRRSGSEGGPSDHAGPRSRPPR